MLILISYFFITAVGVGYLKQSMALMGKEILDHHLNDNLKLVQNSYNILKNKGLSNSASDLKKIQKKMLEQISKFKYKKTGYIFIIDSQKKMIFHPKLKNKTNESQLPYIDTIIQHKNGESFNYQDKNKTRYCVVANFEKWDWIIAISIDEDEIFSPVFSFIKSSLILLISTVLITFTVILLTLRKLIIVPLKQILKHISHILRERDLTKRIKISSKDEMGDLAYSLDLLLEEVHEIFLSVKQSSVILTQSSKDLSSNIDVVRNSIKDIMHSIAQIDKSIANQSDSIRNSYINISQLIVSIKNVGTSIETQSNAIQKNSTAIAVMNDSINSVDHYAKKTNDVSSNLSKVAKEGERSIKDAIKSIMEIETSSQLVTEIVEVISIIAEKSNLLAMNAAIEAAHAGEHGKGFAIVADEVRKLAENTGNSSKEIFTLIQEMSQKIEKGAKRAISAEQALTNIIKDIFDTTELITEISSAMTHQKSVADESLKNITSLVQMTSDITKSIADEEECINEITETISMLRQLSSFVVNNTQKHSDSIHQIAESINQVTITTQNNNQKIKLLETMVNAFKVTEPGQDSSVEIWAVDK